MAEVVYLIIGLIAGLILAWYWLDRKYVATLGECKADFDTRINQARAEIANANKDNVELRDQLVALQFQHQECDPKLKAIEQELLDAQAKIAELEAKQMEQPSAEQAEDQAQAIQIAELKQQLHQERERRQALRSEFEKIEEQLARNGVGAIQLGGDSLALHEASQDFDFDHKPLGIIPSNSQDKPPGSSEHERIISEQSNDVHPQEITQQPDDLKRIKGVGRVLEGKLLALGVTSFHQIAHWTAEDIARIDEHLNFKGRIERENWIEQARNLAG